jgi:hypothetical protein
MVIILFMVLIDATRGKYQVSEYHPVNTHLAVFVVVVVVSQRYPFSLFFL